MVKAILVHYRKDSNKKKHIICLRKVDYSAGKANMLRDKSLLRKIRAFTLKDFDEMFKMKAEETDELTPEMEKFIETIQNNPSSTPGGWRGKENSSTEELDHHIKGDSSNKISWSLNARKDLRDRINSIACKMNLTTVGLVENVLIKWVNENENNGEKILNSLPSNKRVAYYRLGQIAALDEQVFSSKKFNIQDYIDRPLKKLGDFKRKNKSHNLHLIDNFINDTAVLSSAPIEKNKQIYFFAGYCGTDISVFWDV